VFVSAGKYFDVEGPGGVSFGMKYAGLGARVKYNGVEYAVSPLVPYGAPGGAGSFIIKYVRTPKPRVTVIQVSGLYKDTTTGTFPTANNLTVFDQEFDEPADFGTYGKKIVLTSADGADVNISNNTTIDNIKLVSVADPVTQAPVFSPAGPEIVGGTPITISSATASAKIYYTTDGKNPLIYGVDSTNPTTLTVGNNTTLRAVAVDGDKSYETCQTYVYPQVAAPTFTPGSPYISGPTAITIRCATAGAAIYYTLNNGNTMSYSGPVTVNGGDTLQAVAKADGYRDSEMKSITFEVPLAVTLAIDTQNTGTLIPKDLCGTNIDTEGSNPLQDFSSPLSNLQPQVVRFPGGLVGNYYHWADTLGSFSSRKPQWTCYREKTGQFNPLTGAAEYLTLLTTLNSKGMINVNVTDGTAEEAAAWVAFCRGRIGDNRLIGSDANGTNWQTVGYWARQRYELTGIYEPVNVLYWELGNEIVVEPATLLDFAQKMKAVDSDILIGLVTWCDSTIEMHQGEEEFQTKVGSQDVEAALQGNLGQEVDFLIQHSYTGWPRYANRVVIWSNQTVNGIFECPAQGEYKVEFQAKGLGISSEVIALNKVPQISFGVDGEAIQTVTLSEDYQTFTVTANLSAGQHTLGITFLNDYTGDGEDTNVDLVKTFTVSQSTWEEGFDFPEKISDLRQDIEEAQQELTSLDDYCTTHCPQLFIAITEYNRTVSSCVELEGGLYMAEFFRICSEFPKIKTAAIWNTISPNFGMRYSGNGKIIIRPTFYVFQMIKELFDRKVPVSITPNDSDVKILATRNPATNEMSVLMINFGQSAKIVKFASSQGANLTLQNRKYIHGDSMYDNNEQTPKITLECETIQDQISGVIVPKYSVTLFSVRVPTAGDANSDGAVDVGDLGILAANYGGTGKTWAQGDFNSDGVVDVGDLGILAANYGAQASGADFDADYAKVFGSTTTDDNENDLASGGSVCSAFGLPLATAILLMGLTFLSKTRFKD
jgi:alpha-L-arabinofuranosidase